MRKILSLSCLLLFYCLSAKAQIKKGTILIGGEFGYFKDKTKFEGAGNQLYESGAITLSPGKAFKENSIAGLSISYYPNHQHYSNFGNDTVDVRYRRYDLGLFYRKYKRLAEDFYFFMEASAAHIRADQKNTYSLNPGDVKAKQRGGWISLTPGISYQVFKKLQLEIDIPGILTLQYLVTRIDSRNTQVKTSKEETVYMYSSLKNSTGLGYLGVGFHFLL
jgi:hypothetical protein